MTSNFQTYVTTVFAAVASAFAAVTSVFTAVAVSHQYFRSISAVTTVFTAVAAKNTDKATVNNTAGTSVKFSSHGSKISFSVDLIAANVYLIRSTLTIIAISMKYNQKLKMYLLNT